MAQKHKQLEVNARFGHLTCIQSDTGKRKHRNVVGLFRCDCGKMIECESTRVSMGVIISCGCITYDTGNINYGDKFSYLKFIRYIKTKRSDNSTGVFKCDCGNSVVLPVLRVLSHTARSCGCMRSKELSKGVTTHGMADKKIKYI